MRITVVHSYYSNGAPSGENAMVDAQVASLRDRGHQVQLVSRRTDDVATRALHRARSGVEVATGLGATPLTQLRNFTPDVVHVHNLFPNYGTRWLRRWPGPVVATMHNFRPMCASANLFRDGRPCEDCFHKGSLQAVRHACYRDSHVATVPVAIRNRGGAVEDVVVQRADRIIVLSPRAARTFIEHGVPHGKLVTLPNFVTPFPAADEAVNGWLFAGRLSVDKGVKKLMQYWPSDQPLTIVGEGPLESAVASWAKTEGHRFLGRQTNVQVRAILARSVALIIPSLWAEGLPTIYLEALAAGVPTLALAGNSAADDVKQHGTGRTLTSWRDLQERIGDVERQRLSLATKAKARFLTDYSESKWLNRVEAVYKDVIA